MSEFIFRLGGEHLEEVGVYICDNVLECDLFDVLKHFMSVVQYCVRTLQMLVYFYLPWVEKRDKQCIERQTICSIFEHLF